MEENSNSGSGSLNGMKEKNRETILSGQFMISHFEDAEDEADDDEMPDPDRPDPSAPQPQTSQCTDVQRYVPKQKDQTLNRIGIFNQHHELSIETSLSKLFKCMKLAYRQKLTSPKWNRFKGIRLRWKDKIRLNNLIWRCWHMQFILKKKTSCQFASPLDCDIHSKPEGQSKGEELFVSPGCIIGSTTKAVLLEGKYWKRDYNVISAEYKKWRRFYRDRSLENQNVLDTFSEQDFDLSYDEDKALMNFDENLWANDNLFSAISQPFEFPDTREIARFGGIADFIQPSLGPLQPNLGEFMDTFDPIADILNPNRLAPVPEEGTDEILKSLNLFIGDSATTLEWPAAQAGTPVAGAASTATSASMDSTKLRSDQPILGGPDHKAAINSQSVDMDHQQLIDEAMEAIGGGPSQTPQQHQTQQISVGGIQYTAKMFTQDLNNFQRQSNVALIVQSPSSNQFGGAMSRNQQQQQQSQQTQAPQNSIMSVEVKKERKESDFFNSSNNDSKAQLLRHINRREPHNYDKATPTAHQTNIYNQIITQHQQQQQQQQILINTSQNLKFNQSNVLNLSQQQQFDKPMLKMEMTQYSPTGASSLATNASSTLSQDGNAHFKSISLGYPMPAKFPNQQMAPATMTVQNQPELMNQSNKEMFRSNSLPINASLQYISSGLPPAPLTSKQTPPDSTNFALPKYQPKQNHQSKFRSRSNSMVMKQQLQSNNLPSQATLFAATSEPALMQLMQNTSNVPQANTLSQNTSNTFSPQLSNMRNSGSISFSIGTPVAPSSPSTESFFGSSSRQSSPVHQRGKDMDQLDQHVLSPGASSMDGQQRRVGHIYAEQKRRYNIKNGFDVLQSMIPQLQHNPSAKLSKAAILQKGAEYVKQLRTERASVNDKMDQLKKERDILNGQISHLQNCLPANGAPVSRQRTNRILEMYRQHILSESVKNWKFWIFGLIFEPLLESFNSTVSITSLEELHRTAMLWVDQSCSLVELRPAVTNKLRYLSTTMDIWSDNPSTIEDEVVKEIQKASLLNGMNMAQSQNTSASPLVSPISGGVSSDPSLPNSPMASAGSSHHHQKFKHERFT